MWLMSAQLTRRSSQRSVTRTTAVMIASRRRIINNDGGSWRVRHDEAWGEENGTDDWPSPAMHGAYCTDIRHRHHGGMLNKTPPPTGLQILATITTLEVTNYIYFRASGSVTLAPGTLQIGLLLLYYYYYVTPSVVKIRRLKTRLKD